MIEVVYTYGSVHLWKENSWHCKSEEKLVQSLFKGDSMGDVICQEISNPKQMDQVQ